MGVGGWLILGISMVLYALFTDVIPHDWILSLAGGGIIGSSIVKLIHGQ
jgi:hypothetical protein